MGLLDIFKSRETYDIFFDEEIIKSLEANVYAKRIALQSCINLIASTISQTEFEYKRDGKKMKELPRSHQEWLYRINLRPNPNQNAHEFWKKFIHKLIYDEECLVISTDTDDLQIADSYDRIHFDLYGDRFANVTVRDYTFRRSFRMENVLFVEYGNENIQRIIQGMYEDMGKILGRMISGQMRKNQIRSTVSVEAAMMKTEQGQQALQNFIDKAYARIKNNDVAIMPEQKGFDYQEKNTTTTNNGFEEIVKLMDHTLDQVARALGIPPTFMKGDNADSDKPMKNYLKFCIDPLLGLIEDELTEKSLEKSEYMKGQRLKARRMMYSNIFEIAEKIDKLVASGTFNRNEIREAAGEERVDDPKMDEFIITKNYQRDSEGGENE